MNIWKKEPDFNWLVNLRKHIIYPLPPDRQENKGKKGWTWKGPYYTDYGDEGVLDYLFQYINDTNKFAVDIGASSGYGGSNLRYLVDKYNWNSVEFDYSKKWPRMHSRVIRVRVTEDNICNELLKYNTPYEIDLLSLDIDSMDWYVLKSLLKGGFNPNVTIVEYNPIFNYDESMVRTYSEKYNKDHTSGYGASLKAFEELFNKYNHTLVGNIANYKKGIYSNNAVFLNNKFIRDNDIVQSIEELHPVPWMEPWKNKKKDNDLFSIKSNLIKNKIMV